MRIITCIINLFLAAGVTLVYTFSLLDWVLTSKKDFDWGSLYIVISIAWIVFAIKLFRSRLSWPRIGSLIVAAVYAVMAGVGLLMVVRDIWRFDHGNKTIDMDPSTTGAGLIGSVMAIIIFLSLLIALYFLPALPNTPKIADSKES
jgi:uncharacterized membrane protein